MKKRDEEIRIQDFTATWATIMPTKLALAARQSGAREPARPMPHTSRRNMGFAAAFLAHHLPFQSVADGEGRRIAWDLSCLTTFMLL